MKITSILILLSFSILTYARIDTDRPVHTNSAIDLAVGSILFGRLRSANIVIQLRFAYFSDLK